MIEIKSLGGTVLYTAENASDVKTALVQAAKGHAYLRGAYLRGAYLQGADLRGAYLQGADLRGADLQGADLQGAYLQGADLRGAYLQGDIWKQVAAKLEEALQAMNDGGRHWIKGSLEDGSQAYCSVGSVEECAKDDGTVCSLALWLLAMAAGGSVSEFNDYAETTWDDIQAVFGVAIMHAKRFGAKS